MPCIFHSENSFARFVCVNWSNNQSKTCVAFVLWITCSCRFKPNIDCNIYLMSPIQFESLLIMHWGLDVYTNHWSTWIFGKSMQIWTEWNGFQALSTEFDRKFFSLFLLRVIWHWIASSRSIEHQPSLCQICTCKQDSKHENTWKISEAECKEPIGIYLKKTANKIK